MGEAIVVVVPFADEAVVVGVEVVDWVSPVAVENEPVVVDELDCPFVIASKCQKWKWKLNWL